MFGRDERRLTNQRAEDSDQGVPIPDRKSEVEGEKKNNEAARVGRVKMAACGLL